MTHLDPAIASAPLPRAARPAQPDPRSLVANTVDYMRRNLEDEALSLTQLAGRSNLSHYQMIRMFKAHTGVTPAKFLFALRIDHAKRLLLQTDRRVTDICFDVGYTSMGTFVSRFTAAVGLSPSRFRTFRDRQATCLTGVIDQLLRAACAGPRPRTVEGMTIAPPGFSGPVFIGRFATCIPEGRPRDCAVTPGTGRFVMPAPRGSSRHWYFALAVPWRRIEAGLLGDGELWRGSGDSNARTLRVALRPSAELDPPVVTFLPALLFGAANPQPTARTG